MLDRETADRAQACVRDQLVGARQHRDRVELYGPKMPKRTERPARAWITAQTATMGRGDDTPEETLGAKLDPACLLGGEL
ncbi:hypothetical protein GCM10027176_86810 [Actinoallomurus bryophytorum]